MCLSVCVCTEVVSRGSPDCRRIKSVQTKDREVLALSAVAEGRGLDYQDLDPLASELPDQDIVGELKEKV